MVDGNEFQYDFKKRSDAAVNPTVGASLTVQSDAVDADINVIVRRFGITGQMPQNLRLPEFGDFDGVDNFLDAQAVIQAAEREFMSIPAEIRARFDNDPGVFFQVAAEPANIEYMRELGLAPRPVVPSRDGVTGEISIPLVDKPS